MLDFSTYPPTRADAERLARYAYFEQIFDGDYAEAFARTSAQVDPDEEILYLGADWGALISKVSSDMLFGEAPIVSVAEGQAHLDELLKQVGLFSLLAEASLSQSFRGDAVLLLEFDLKRRLPVVTEIPACNYFVEVSQDNGRAVTEECIAWKRTIGKTTFLRVDRHLPGLVKSECYRVQGPRDSWLMASPALLISRERCERCELSEAYPNEVAPLPERRTGLTRSAVFHAPNLRHGSRYFGISDYAGGLASLFDSYNERLSDIHGVLSKHADPKLLLPEGVIDPNGQVKVKDLGCIELPPGAENGDSFRYLIWDGQLIPAFRQAELLEALIFKFSETSPAIFGADKAGSIESGRAMKFRFQRTLAKMARKKRIWDPLLKDLIWHLVSLAATYKVVLQLPDGSQVLELKERPEIAWQDGLPLDLSEQVDIEEKRVNAGLSSRVSAIQRLDLTPRAKAEAELKQRKVEEETYARSGPAPGNPAQPTQPPALPGTAAGG